MVLKSVVILLNIFVVTNAGIIDVATQNDIDNPITMEFSEHEKEPSTKIEPGTSNSLANPYGRFEYKHSQDGVIFGCYGHRIGANWQDYETHYYVSDSHGRRNFQKYQNVLVHYADGRDELKLWTDIQFPDECIGVDIEISPSELQYVSSCPVGYRGHPPDCYEIPKLCPGDQSGSPNCYKFPVCPSGSTGVFPNCQCPVGFQGTPPNCYSSPKCPFGYQGSPPNCFVANREVTYRPLIVEKACPEGETGMYPVCYKLCCPSNTKGEYPNCECADGFEGQFPYCRPIQKILATPESKCLIITPPTTWEVPPDCPCMLRLPPIHNQYLPPARDYLPPSRQYLPINKYLPPKTIETTRMEETRCDGKFPTAQLSLPIPMLYVPFCNAAKPMSNIDSSAMSKMFPNALAVPYSCSRCQSNTLSFRNWGK